MSVWADGVWVVQTQIRKHAHARAHAQASALVEKLLRGDESRELAGIPIQLRKLRKAAAKVCVGGGG